MLVRALQPTDATLYRALMLEAYANEADAFTSTVEDRANEPASFWAQRIADPAGLSLAWGAWAGDALVGSVALEFYKKFKSRHKGLVIGMYVVPSARGQGVGRALLAAALAHANTKADVRVLNLTVTLGNEPAIRLYRDAGFQTFGVEPMAIATEAGFLSKVHMQRVLDHATSRPDVLV